MRNFSLKCLNNQCRVVEELVCFLYFSNDKNSHYREKQNKILNILVSSHLKFQKLQNRKSSKKRKKGLSQYLKLATHLAILYADRGEFDRQRKSQAIFATD